MRWGGCTVRTGKLAGLWDRYVDGDIDFDYEARTTVYHRYYT